MIDTCVHSFSDTFSDWTHLSLILQLERKGILFREYVGWGSLYIKFKHFLRFRGDKEKEKEAPESTGSKHHMSIMW